MRLSCVSVRFSSSSDSRSGSMSEVSENMTTTLYATILPFLIEFAVQRAA